MEQWAVLIRGHFHLLQQLQQVQGVVLDRPASSLSPVVEDLPASRRGFIAGVGLEDVPDDPLRRAPLSRGTEPNLLPCAAGEMVENQLCPFVI